MQTRIAAGVEKELQSTQYGFRREKSTADSIYLVRRIVEYGARTKNRLTLILLDWVKAFDKVDMEKLMASLKIIGKP